MSLNPQYSPRCCATPILCSNLGRYPPNCRTARDIRHASHQRQSTTRATRLSPHLNHCPLFDDNSIPIESTTLRKHAYYECSTRGDRIAPTLSVIERCECHCVAPQSSRCHPCVIRGRCQFQTIRSWTRRVTGDLRHEFSGVTTRHARQTDL